MGKVVEKRADNIGCCRCGGGCFAQIFVDRFKVFHNLFFMGKNFDITLAGNHFFDIAVYGSGMFLLFTVTFTAYLGGNSYDKNYYCRKNDHYCKKAH